MFRDVAEFTKARITKDEALLLSRYASQAKGAIVELGTLQGGAAELLAEYAPKGTQVWAVDIFQREDCANPAELYRTILQPYGSAFIVVGDSSAVGRYWDRPVWILFIDADHGKVWRDCEAWSRWVEIGGYIIFHDVYGERKDTLDGATCRGINEVRRDVSILLESKNWRQVEAVDSIAVLQRGQP